MATPRAYELVVWGASGFTGRLACEYLSRWYAPQDRGGPNAETREQGPGLRGVRWAMAGRNASKLASVREKIERAYPHVAGKIPIILGSTDDPASLEAIASSTSVVLSFAGPFQKAGRPLVAACVKCGTDYLDITGEPTFVRSVIDEHDETAKNAGVCIVNCVGYDSVPWDLGAWAAAGWIKNRGDECVHARGLVGATKGGISGGTFASALDLFAMTPWHELRAMASAHFLTADDSDKDVRREWRLQSTPIFDPDANAWTMPSIMAGVNSKIVARSARVSLPFSSGGVYPCSFVYDEGHALRGSFLAACAGCAALACFGASLAFPPTRWLLRRFILPKPGQGPSEETRETGFAHTYVFAHGAKASTPTAVARLQFKSCDPGYKGTAALAIEAALCLAMPDSRKGTPGAKAGGGCLTPATALGPTLVDRLNATNLFEFEVGALGDFKIVV